MTAAELQAELDAKFLASSADSSASWRGRIALGEADGKPGRYYVTARDDAGRTAFLLGPFVQTTPGQQAHARALGRVRSAKTYLTDRNYRSAFYTFGTARLDLFGSAPAGKLNDLIAKEKR